MLDINETTLVQVLNKGDKALKYSYASRPYLLPPGKAVGVPYYAACLWFGNPLAVDEGNAEDRHLKRRTMEVDRLSTLYGLNGAPWTTPTSYTQTDPLDDRIQHVYVERGGEYWHPNLPNVEVRDLEGEILAAVVTDPSGDDVTPAQASSRSEAIATKDAIQSLQQQLRALQLQLARAQDTQPVSDPLFSTPGTTDTPLVAPEAEPVKVGAPTIDAPAKRGPGRPRKVN